MFLLIDSINQQGTRSVTTRHDKIKNNIDLIAPLKQSIERQRSTQKDAFSSITVFGRWLVVYKANVNDDENTIMYFIDFRIDLGAIMKDGIFSKDTMQGLLTLQARYDDVFTTKMDTVELTHAEPFEKVVKGDIFACDIDEIVIAKSRELGAFPMIENFIGNDKVKIAIVDEKQLIDEEEIINIYALIHFGGFSQEEKHENGFAYLKIFDLKNNTHKIEAFERAIEEVGGKLDRAFFMERFAKHKLN